MPSPPYVCIAAALRGLLPCARKGGRCDGTWLEPVLSKGRSANATGRYCNEDDAVATLRWSGCGGVAVACVGSRGRRPMGSFTAVRADG